jgi:DNA-binding PadR family transcriptional regulator
MELSGTATVILGMLALRPMSGYEIKALSDKSTRFFWAASYGQIYPELRRLADAGLIEGESRPQGGRRRTVYRLTREGRKRLREWLETEPEVLELRDEALLKLFFADSAAPDAAAEILEAKRRRHLEIIEALRAIEPLAAAKPERFPHLVARYGIEFNQWQADWCERAARELYEAAKAERRSA